MRGISSGALGAQGRALSRLGRKSAPLGADHWSLRARENRGAGEHQCAEGQGPATEVVEEGDFLLPHPKYRL